MPPRLGEVAEQAAHPAHALGVEAVGGLVEDQHLRVAEQRVGDPEPLAHAERVLADALARGRAVEADQLQHLVDAAAPDAEQRRRTARVSRPVRPACWAEASISTPTRRPGLVRFWNGEPSTVATPELGGVSPHSIFSVVDLPAPLGPRKPVTVPGFAGERHILHGGAPAVALGE